MKNFILFLPHQKQFFVKQECRGQSLQVRLRGNRMKVLMAAMESWCNKLSFETSFVEISKIFPEIINIMCKFQRKLDYDNKIFWPKFIIFNFFMKKICIQWKTTILSFHLMLNLFTYVQLSQRY